MLVKIRNLLDNRTLIVDVEPCGWRARAKNAAAVLWNVCYDSLQAERTDIEALSEEHDVASEHYGEIDTQFRSEVALYGDAWPGAALQRQQAWETLKAAEEALVQAQAIVGAEAAPFDDIPY